MMKNIEKEAKRLFSQLVRLRGCLDTTGSLEYGKCFTCGTPVAFERLHCGHFISGRTNSLFFEENNSHIQCEVCNTFKGGNIKRYRQNMMVTYGLEEVERLESLRHKAVKFFDADFKEFKAKFKRDLALLVEGTDV